MEFIFIGVNRKMSNYVTNNKISASQLETWIKSPKEYIEQYINDRPFIGNKYTRFGTEVHKQIESDNFFYSHIPKLKNKEYYFEKQVKKIILNGYIDSYDIGEIIDYKVSKKGRWTQKKVDKHIQLSFYGLWHFLEYDSLPIVHIIHVISEEDDRGILRLTGEIKDYKRQITMEDIDYIKNKINEFVRWCEDYKLKNSI